MSAFHPADIRPVDPFALNMRVRDGAAEGANDVCDEAPIRTILVQASDRGFGQRRASGR